MDGYDGWRFVVVFFDGWEREVFFFPNMFWKGEGKGCVF